MFLNYGLILSAGIGSRMGEIGKVLPKPIWPLFEKTFLQLQIEYLISLGVNYIYVNTHHLASMVEGEIAKIESTYPIKIEVIYEKVLLDIGGSIHNICRLINKKEKDALLLVTCVDQFLFMEDNFFPNVIKGFGDKKVVLVGVNVPKKLRLNMLDLDNLGHLKGIVNFSKIESLKGDSNITFSGMSVIRCSRFGDAHGPSNFFETVANYKEDTVEVKIPENSEYWEFGSLKNYFDGCFDILNNYNQKRDSKLIRFLIKNKSLKEPKILGLSYSDTKKNNYKIINMSKCKSPDLENKKCIIIDGEVGKINEQGIYYKELFQQI